MVFAPHRYKLRESGPGSVLPQVKESRALVLSITSNRTTTGDHSNVPCVLSGDGKERAPIAKKGKHCVQREAVSWDAPPANHNLTLLVVSRTGYLLTSDSRPRSRSPSCAFPCCLRPPSRKGEEPSRLAPTCNRADKSRPNASCHPSGAECLRSSLP